MSQYLELLLYNFPGTLQERYGITLRRQSRLQQSTESGIFFHCFLGKINLDFSCARQRIHIKHQLFSSKDSENKYSVVC